MLPYYTSKSGSNRSCFRRRFRYEVDPQSTWHDFVWTQFRPRSGKERSPILELCYEILACVQYLGPKLSLPSWTSPRFPVLPTSIWRPLLQCYYCGSAQGIENSGNQHAMQQNLRCSKIWDAQTGLDLLPFWYSFQHFSIWRPLRKQRHLNSMTWGFDLEPITNTVLDFMQTIHRDRFPHCGQLHRDNAWGLSCGQFTLTLLIRCNTYP